MNDIVPLTCITRRHSKAVAALHMQHLPTPFRGGPGRRLLSAYYRAVAGGRGAIGYIAEEQGHILGYVCGVWDPAALRAQMFKAEWPTLMLWGPVSVLFQPQLMASFAQRFTRPAEREVEPAPAAEYELRPIVLDPASRGTGLAVRMVERLMLDARDRGFTDMVLYVEAGNQAAQAFYRKMGFTAVSHLQPPSGLIIRLERSLQDSE